MFSRRKQKCTVEYGSLEQPNLVVALSNSHIKNTYKNKMYYLKYMKLPRVIIHIMLLFENSATYLGSCNLVRCPRNIASHSNALTMSAMLWLQSVPLWERHLL